MNDKGEILTFDTHTVNLSYLRQRKARRLKDFLMSIRSVSELRIKEYKNVSLCPLGNYDSSLHKNDEELLKDDTDFCTRIIRNSEKAKAFLKLDGRFLYGGYLRKTWGHFLMGTLARLWPLADLDFRRTFDKIIFFAENKNFCNLSGNYLEIFRLLGIEDKILIICNQDIYVEKLLAPDPAFLFEYYHSPQFGNLFRLIRNSALESLMPDNGGWPEKVFLTRSAIKGAVKKEINILSIDRFFRDNGFEIISPEQISVSRFIAILCHAKTIASFSGSLAHNSVFLSGLKNKTFIIVEREPMINMFQAQLEGISQLNSIYVDANRIPFCAKSGHVFLYGKTHEFEAFINDFGYDGKSLANMNSSRRKQLSRYLKSYRREFGHAVLPNRWEIDYADCLAEAAIDTSEYFAPWLLDKKPLTISDLLSPRYLFRLGKNVIKL